MFACKLLQNIAIICIKHLLKKSYLIQISVENYLLQKNVNRFFDVLV